MSTSCCPWWTGDTRDNISDCAFTLLPLMSLSSIQGQFPLFFRLLCVPKQIGEPLWGPSMPVLCLAYHATCWEALNLWRKGAKAFGISPEQAGLLRECLTRAPGMPAVANKWSPCQCTFSHLLWSKNVVADPWLNMPFQVRVANDMQ